MPDTTGQATPTKPARSHRRGSHRSHRTVFRRGGPGGVDPTTWAGSVPAGGIDPWVRVLPGRFVALTGGLREIGQRGQSPKSVNREPTAAPQLPTIARST